MSIMPVSYTHLDVYKRQQVDCWEKKIMREESDRTNWRIKAPELLTVSKLHKISGNLIVNRFAEGKPTSFTADTGARVH